MLPTIESECMIFRIHDVQDMIILIACARVVFDKCYLWPVMTVRVVNTGRNLFRTLYRTEHRLCRSEPQKSCL